MAELKKLPDAEFEVMKVVWSNEPPITTGIIMEQLGRAKKWKVQTVISLMLRLVDRGFLRTEKNGKERSFFPEVSKDEYLRFETGNFIEQYHNNSFLNLVNTLYSDNSLTDKDIDELLQWLKERRG
ncbi:MAG: BlaI/MecI/CopY family transcriptional regulator [Clostridiales bacterium]|nr:BlaI/MecI/CopY family transcriptional regulator [Clostridiales bacterium]